MHLGKILGSISPAVGIATGSGLFGNQDLLGTLSPLYGMISGKGMFGSPDMMSGLGLLSYLLHSSHSQPTQPQNPTGMQPQADPSQYLSSLFLNSLGN